MTNEQNTDAQKTNQSIDTPSTFPKVTVVGAGQVGATTAKLLLLQDLADVVLIDVAEGLPQGKALDMMQARSVLKFAPTIIGTNDYADTAGSDIVVITAGVPRKPGMTREDLLEINSSIIKSVIGQALEQSPDAIVICVTNPLDVMVHLAATESGLPHKRVFGMGGVLDSARFTHAIAEATGVAQVEGIDAMVVGAHGEAMVPLASLAMVDAQPLSDLLTEEEIASVRQKAITGGAQIVSLLKTGSAFYAPAASIVKMIEAILTDSDEVLSVCAYLDGQYGIEDVYMCVPAKLDRSGVSEIIELDISDDEQAQLVASAASIKQGIDALGQSDAS